MIGMAVGMQYGHDRPCTQMLIGQIECRARCFTGSQRINDDPARVAANEGHVGDVERANLVEPVHYLKQAVVLGVELGLAPEARIDRIRGVVPQETYSGQIENRAPPIRLADRERLDGGDESTSGIFKTAPVFERQRCPDLGICSYGM